MKTESLAPVRIALLVGTPTTILLERATDADGKPRIALPSQPMEHGQTLKEAAARLAKCAGVGEIKAARALVLVRGGRADAAPSSDAPPALTIAMTVDTVESPTRLAPPLAPLDSPARITPSATPAPAQAGDPAAPAPTRAQAAPTAPDTVGLSARAPGPIAEAACTYFLAPLTALPVLEPWANGVLNACQIGQHILDLDGNYVPMGGALPWMAEPVGHGEPDLDDFARTLRRRTANAGRPPVGYRGWVAGAARLAASLSWATGVFGTLAQPGQLGGATALLFWSMTLAIAWAAAVRWGFPLPAPNGRSRAVRILLVGIGAASLVPIGALGLVMENDVLAWVLVVLGTGGHLLAWLLTRDRRCRDCSVPTRAVGALIWATLLFTTAWTMSAGLRELVRHLHAPHDTASTLGDDDREEAEDL